MQTQIFGGNGGRMLREIISFVINFGVGQAYVLFVLIDRFININKKTRGPKLYFLML